LHRGRLHGQGGIRKGRRGGVRQSDGRWDRGAGREQEVDPPRVLVRPFVGGQDGALALPRNPPLAGRAPRGVVVFPFDHQDLGPVVASAGLELEAGKRRWRMGCGGRQVGGYAFFSGRLGGGEGVDGMRHGVGLPKRVTLGGDHHFCSES